MSQNFSLFLFAESMNENAQRSLRFVFYFFEGKRRKKGLFDLKV